MCESFWKINFLKCHQRWHSRVRRTLCEGAIARVQSPSCFAFPISVARSLRDLPDAVKGIYKFREGSWGLTRIFDASVVAPSAPLNRRFPRKLIVWIV